MSETIYTAGQWWVEVAPHDSGAVVFRVSQAGKGWKLSEYSYSLYSPARRGWSSPRWWQRSLRRALRWAVRLADKNHRRDVQAEQGMEAARTDIEGLRRHADALRTLEMELSP